MAQHSDQRCDSWGGEEASQKNVASVKEQKGPRKHILSSLPQGRAEMLNLASDDTGFYAKSQLTCNN